MKCVDDLGRAIVLDVIPQRIISLVPSLTELLFYLGAGDRVIGVTKFCVHPADQINGKKKVGGTKKVNIDQIRSLQPDLIIANKEENTKEEVEQMMLEFNVYVTDIGSLSDAYHTIDELGRMLNCGLNAKSLLKKIQSEFTELSVQPSRRVLYLIWKSPWMTIGKDTFIHHLLSSLGFDNIVKDKVRYPLLADEVISDYKPELVLLSSEPYPFKEKHLAEVQKLFPDAQILLVDGEMFSWYGSRLALVPAYFAKLLNELKK